MARSLWSGVDGKHVFRVITDYYIPIFDTAMLFLLSVGRFQEGARGGGGGIICPYCSPAWSGFAFGIGHIHGDLSLVVRCVRSSGDGPPAPVV